MADDDLYFSITVDGQPRLLFRIEERAKPTDLLIKIRHPKIAKLVRPLGEIKKAAPPLLKAEETRVKEFHYSVHCSEKSKERINVIKGSLLTDAGEKLPIPHYTEAIKQTDRYAHIFAIRCTDLSHNHFVLREPVPRSISLGEYDPSKFQLIYQVLVSNNDQPRLLVPADTQCKEIEFASFSRCHLRPPHPVGPMPY
jgi:hypothetical protein